MLDLKIKTSCDRYSRSRDKKVFTFCQNNQCCSTGPIPAQNQNCQENSYQGVEIGDCSEFKFATDNVVGNVTYAHLPSASDGWKPEWVKLVLKNDHILKCSFYGTSRMDGDDVTEPTFLNFVCKPEGML